MGRPTKQMAVDADLKLIEHYKSASTQELKRAWSMDVEARTRDILRQEFERRSIMPEDILVCPTCGREL